MSCTICQHPQRQAIDQALIAGSATLAALGQQYNLSTSALHRHKAHLQAKVNRAKDQLQENLRQGCLFWLSQALEMSMQIAQAAQAEGNVRVVLQAIRQGTSLIRIILKQDLHLDDRVIYEILASPQWATQTTLLPQDPRIMSLSRQSLTGALASPCPETADPSLSPSSPEDLDLNALQEVLATLVQSPVTQPKPENRLLNGRDKSGKSAGKTLAKKDNNEKYQEDKLWEKITGIMAAPALSRIAPVETLFPELDKSGTIPTNIPLSEYIHEQSLRGGKEKGVADLY
jgi:hypothetical protein